MAQPPTMVREPRKRPASARQTRRPRRLRWGAGALLALLALGVGAYGLAVWPQSQLYGPIVTRGPSGERLVALTFDDGPNEPATSQILDVLAARGVKATFFVVGANARAYPDTLRRIVAEGHAVGNHSYRHRKRDTLLDPRYREVERTQRVIEEIAGIRPALYRSPNGFHTPWQLRAVRGAGLTTVHWDVQTKDWERPDPETIVRRVLAHVHPGAIVLLHDGDDTRHGSDRTPTVQALPRLIDALEARGYRLVTVPALLGRPATLPGSALQVREHAHHDLRERRQDHPPRRHGRLPGRAGSPPSAPPSAARAAAPAPPLVLLRASVIRSYHDHHPAQWPAPPTGMPLGGWPWAGVDRCRGGPAGPVSPPAGHRERDLGRRGPGSC
jgi:peptidoglycan/xylan/chitin deacetylase (PgdA/CDA1 family)